MENFSEALTFHSFSEFFSVVLFGISYCFLKKLKRFYCVRVSRPKYIYARTQEVRETWNKSDGESRASIIGGKKPIKLEIRLPVEYTIRGVFKK